MVDLLPEEREAQAANELANNALRAWIDARNAVTATSADGRKATHAELQRSWDLEKQYREANAKRMAAQALARAARHRLTSERRTP